MSFVILATPCAYFLQLPVDTYAPLVPAGARQRKSTEIWSRRMRILLTYRSHFGSRYHTRADAVTQAFFLLVRPPHGGFQYIFSPEINILGRAKQQNK